MGHFHFNGLFGRVIEVIDTGDFFEVTLKQKINGNGKKTSEEKNSDFEITFFGYSVNKYECYVLWNSKRTRF